jgi:hypothetical protein
MVTEHLQHELLADLLVRKLGKHGVRVTARQRARIAKWFADGAKGEPPLPHVERRAKDVTITFTPRDERRLKGRWTDLMDNVAEVAAELTHKTAARLARPALKDLKREWLREVNLDERYLRGFRRRLARTWKTPFDLLEVQRHLACSVAAEINEELRRKSRKADAPLVEVLTSLHARACQIAAEVLVLLHAGYPEGAITRWRSLHEVSIVLHFIDKHGVETAKRYLDHDVVESWKAANEYAKHCDELGFEPIEAGKLAQVKRAYDAALKKYGPDFLGTYGWAALDLNKGPKFTDIEKGAGFEHWRPMYRLASHPVHANPKSVKYRMGMIEGATRYLPVGPSNYGLADPGQNTGLSLAQATAVLIARAPTLERLIAMWVMNELTGRIARALAAVQRRIEVREMKLRAKLPPLLLEEL